jgi:hypothetical protein
MPFPSLTRQVFIQDGLRPGVLPLESLRNSAENQRNLSNTGHNRHVRVTARVQLYTSDFTVAGR